MKKCFLFALIGSFLLITSCAVFRGSLAYRDIAAEYYNIAEGYAGLSKYDKAILYYQKASLQKEFRNAAEYGMGRMYALSGKWHEACDVFSGLYKKDPDNELIASAYAYALASDGKKEQALEMYAALYRKHPDDPQVMRNYAEMQVVSGKYAEALETVESLKVKFPDSDALKGIDALEKKANDGLSPPPDTIPAAPEKSAKKNGKKTVPAANGAAPSEPSPEKK